MSRVRVHVIALAGVCCVVALWMSPGRSQDLMPAPEEAPAEKVQPSPPSPPPDPRKATTTKDPTILVEELELMVRPLTLEELQNEAAAWMGLLQKKALEISDAEVAVRRQKLSVDKQKEATDAIAKAKQALADAEKAQAGAKQGTPEYEQATKKVEEAKEELKRSQEAVKEAAQTKKELKQTKELDQALKDAKKAGELDSAKELLDKTKQERDAMTADSLEYQEATQKIDELDKAIKAYEAAKEKQDQAPPDTPEHQQATSNLDKALKTLVKAEKNITGSGNAEEPKEQSSTSISNTAAELEKAKVPTKSLDDQAATAQKQEQLGKTIDKLEESTEADTEIKNKLLVNVTNLQAEQTALIDRTNVVLTELTNKGGDAEPYRKYIQAISGVKIDAQDTEGALIRLTSWLKSSEGGLRWAGNFGKFVGIILATAIVSQILAVILNFGLKRFGNTSALLRQFIIMMVKRGGVVVGILLALTALEVSLGPILAILGGASFVLAFALQSNLGNFASGLMMLVYKPFDVGDEVIIGDIWGWVDSITLASTKIRGWKAQTYILPNNTVWSSTIENLTAKDTRRGVITIGATYDTDLRKFQKILLGLADAHPLVLKDPAPLAFLWEYNEYTIDFKFGFWTKSTDFWNVWEDLHFQIMEQFEQENITIPYPRRNINVQIEHNGQTPAEALVQKLNETLKEEATDHPVVDQAVMDQAVADQPMAES